MKYGCTGKASQVQGKLRHKSIEFAERREMSWYRFEIYFWVTIYLYCE